MSERRISLGSAVRTIYLVAFFGFLVAPIVVIVLASLTAGDFIVFPPRGLSLRWFAEIANHREFLDSLRLSLGVGCATALASTVLGTLAAVGIDRYAGRGRDAFVQLFSSPLLVPSVVLGIALLQWYSTIGLPSGLPALILGHLVLTIPYQVRLVFAGLAGIDRSLVTAAQTLGATTLQAMLKVTLPIVRSSIVAGALFSFVTSFDDLTVALFVVTTNAVTLPVRIFNYMQFNYDPLITSVSTVMIVLSFAGIIAIERSFGVARVFTAGEREKVAEPPVGAAA